MMLVVKNLRSSRVNLVGNDFVSGLPSPFAFLGLGAVLAPRFGVDRWKVGVMPILHSVEASVGRTKGEQVKASNNWKTIEIPEDIRGTVSFSLLFDFGDDVYVEESDFTEAVLSARLAGGAIFPDAGRVTRTENVMDGGVFQTVRRGRCFLPVAGKPIAYGQNDDLMKLAEEVFPEERQKGCFVPSAVSYRMVGVPSTERKNVRDKNVPHVFVEPGAGVAELVSPRNSRLKDLDNHGLRDLLWRYATRPGHVAAHPLYL